MSGRTMVRAIILGTVVVMVALYALSGRPQQRAWYVERGQVLASFTTAGNRSCAPLLVSGGRFMGGKRLAIFVDAYEPGRRFRNGDVWDERLAIAIADPVFDQPIEVTRSRVELYFTRSGPPAPVRSCRKAAYADSGTGTILLHREGPGRLRVDLSLELDPEDLPVPGARELPPRPPGIVLIRRTVTAAVTEPILP